ncbi:hypothetical protein IAT40_001533 [Kwoniella sp. CBS 6097]
MAPSSDFLSSLRRPKTKRCTQAQPHTHPPRSGTSNTLSTWVDIDPITGQDRLLNVNPPPVPAPYSQTQMRLNSEVSLNLRMRSGWETHPSSPSLYAPSSSVRQPSLDNSTSGAESISRGVSLRKVSDREGRTGKLKRRSMQLLKMVSGSGSVSIAGENRKSSARELQIVHTTFDEHTRPSISSISRPSMSYDSHTYASGSVTTSTPPLTPSFSGNETNIHTYEASSSHSSGLLPTPPSIQSHDQHPSPGHSLSSNSPHDQPLRTRTTSKNFTPIPPRFMLSSVGDENTPPSRCLNYPSYAGDSDSSGKKPTLRPTRSAVPHNTPLSGLGINAGPDLSSICEPFPNEGGARGTPTPSSERSWKYSPKRRLTFEHLMDVPLPAPNGEPSRYLQSLEPNLGLTTEVMIPSASNPRSSEDLDFNSLTRRFEDSTVSARENDPVFDVSSALEALWEYGSTGSATLQEGLDVDVELDPDAFPLPPAVISSGTEPLHLQRRLTGSLPEDDISVSTVPVPPGLGSTNGPPRDKSGIPFSDTCDAEMHPSTRDQPIPSPSTVSVSTNPPKIIRAGKTHKATPSTISTNYPISSPLSDGYLSMDEDEDEGEGIIVDARGVGHSELCGSESESVAVAGVETAYRIPLKFVKPEARRRTSLSAG